MRYPCREKAEIARKRYLYEELILKRKVNLPVRVARRLIGPDRAYHLYGLNKGNTRKV